MTVFAEMATVTAARTRSASMRSRRCTTALTQIGGDYERRRRALFALPLALRLSKGLPQDASAAVPEQRRIRAEAERLAFPLILSK